MCNLYSITTNQEAIIRLFRVINRYVGNLPPMPGVFPDYPAPVIRNTGDGREMTLMRDLLLLLEQVGADDNHWFGRGVFGPVINIGTFSEDLASLVGTIRCALAVLS